MTEATNISTEQAKAAEQLSTAERAQAVDKQPVDERAQTAERTDFVADAQAASEVADGPEATPKAARKVSGSKKRGRKKRSRGPRPSTVIAVVVLVAGVGLLVYPTFSDWWNSYHQSRAIATFVQAVQETDPKQLERMLDEARAYNERLLADNNRWNMDEADKAEYNSLLNLTGNGVMGYVQVSSIGVDYPIYHGMDESILQVAIGHLEGSSLPVGGPNTHSAVSGHRGLPSARLFTDLDKMREGDTFTITILNQTVTYEVDQIRIVLPDDLSELNIEAGKDYATLITCTPYGINTHRLLLRGHRIENIEDADAITADAIQIPRYIAIPAVGIPLLFMFLLGSLIYYRVRRPVANQEAVVAAIKERIHNEQPAAEVLNVQPVDVESIDEKEPRS